MCESVRHTEDGASTEAAFFNPGHPHDTMRQLLGQATRKSTSKALNLRLVSKHSHLKYLQLVSIQL